MEGFHRKSGAREIFEKKRGLFEGWDIFSLEEEKKGFYHEYYLDSPFSEG